MNRELNHKKPGQQNLGLYLGLLTHKNSKFPKAPFVDLFEKGSNLGSLMNINVSYSISEDNLFSSKDVGLIDLLLVRFFELRLYKEWSSYVANEKIRKLRKNDLRVLTSCFLYYYRLLQPRFRMKEKVRYSRILNINAGHKSLLQDFLKSRAQVGLIFEDDASFETSTELIRVIFELGIFAQSIKSVAYFIDLSDSFTIDELGVQHLVIQPKSPGRIFLGSQMLATTKPFTNCTCAVLYSRYMAEVLCSALESYASIRGKCLIPIDWSFNQFLLESVNSKLRIECFHLDPGLFPQQSLIATQAK